MKSIKYILGIASLLFLGSAQAELLDKVKMVGTIDNLNKETVFLKTVGGIIKIPRAYFDEKSSPLKPNLGVSVQVSLTDIVRYNKKKK